MPVEISVAKDAKKRKCLNLATFSNGTVNSKHAGELNADILARPNCTNLRLKEHRIMVAETKKMSYVGKNFGEITVNKARGLCKYYVGVLDPTTNKMMVYDTEKYLLQPHIPGRDELDMGQDPTASYMEKETPKAVLIQTVKTQMSDNSSGSSQFVKQDMLTSAFGSSRKRKAMDTRIRHHVKTDVLEGALNSAVDKGLVLAQTHKVSEENSKDEESTNVPPCNKEADRVDDVYRLSDIISSSEMEVLTSSAKPFIDSDTTMVQEWRKTEEYPTYVLNHLATMPLNIEMRERRAKCLLYLSYMIKLFRMNNRLIRIKDPLPSDWPAVVKKNLLSGFTKMVLYGNRANRCAPSRLKDKLVTYILTLCLIIDEYILDLTDLIKDLKVGKPKMVMYAQSLGCTVDTKKSTSSTATAILKLPLKFPAPRMMKKK